MCMCFGKKSKFRRTETAIPPAKPVRMSFKEVDYSSSDSDSTTSSSSTSSIFEKNRNPSLVSSAYLKAQPSPCSSARPSCEIPDYPPRRQRSSGNVSSNSDDEKIEVECIEGVDPSKVSEKLMIERRRNTCANGLLSVPLPAHVKLARTRPKSASGQGQGGNFQSLNTVVDTKGFEGR